MRILPLSSNKSNKPEYKNKHIFFIPIIITMIQILKAFGYPKQGINRYQSQHKFITYCHQLTNKNKCFLIYFKHTIFIKHINRNGKNTYTLNLKNIVTHMLTAIKQN